MADETYHSVVLALLQVAFLGKYDDQGLGPWGRQIQLSSLSSIIVLQPPLLSEGRGGGPLCLSGDNSELMDLHWPRNCTAQSSILSNGSVSLVLM